MKKTIFKKISFSLILSVLLGSYLISVSTSRADDDEGEEYDQWEEKARDDERVEEKKYQEEKTSIKSKVTPVLQSNIAPRDKPDKTALLASLQDSDQDGIVDIADKYPGQDDFSFIIVDNNRNGVADELEILTSQ